VTWQQSQSAQELVVAADVVQADLLVRAELLLAITASVRGRDGGGGRGGLALLGGHGGVSE
jgi:hypothetical protein